MHVFTIETLHAKQFISGKLHTIFTVRRGGGSVMLWDCFFFSNWQKRADGSSWKKIRKNK